MLAVLVLFLVALASAETMYVTMDPPEIVGVASLAWEANGTWVTAEGTASTVPGPNDDVVCVAAEGCRSAGWALSLTSEVFVRSVSISTSPDGCVSFVIEGGGWLHAESFNVSDRAKVYLNQGTISAPTLLFDLGAELGGSGTITGEVVMRGAAKLYAGESSRLACLPLRRSAGPVQVGAGCWPGFTLIENGMLSISTLRVGPAVIQGGLLRLAANKIGGVDLPEVTWGVAVERLVVDAGTTTELLFLSPGDFVTFKQIEVSRLYASVDSFSDCRSTLGRSCW